MKSLKVNLILNIIKTTLNIVFPLITFPYVARVLDKGNIGKIEFGNSYISYFMLIASLGISTYAIRECSKFRNDKLKLEKISSEIYSINMFTTIISYLVLFVSLIIFKKLYFYRYLILIQSTVILFQTLGTDWLNVAMEDFTYITLRSIFFQIFSIVALFVFVKNSEDYVKYAVIAVISSSGANFLNIWYRKRYCKVHLKLRVDWRKHIKPILYLFIMSLSQVILNKIDITMLGFLCGDKSVGVYSTADKMENLTAQIVSAMVFVLLPRFSNMFQNNDYAKINTLLRKVLQVFITIGFPLVAGCFIMSREIVLIIAGESFIESSGILKVLMLAFLFSLVGGSFLGNVVLLPSGREKLFMKICFIAMLVNVILNSFFIPLFGTIGAAIATVIVSFVILILLLYTKDERIRIKNMSKIFLSPLIGSIAIIVYCLIMKLFFTGLWGRSIICVFGGIVVYIIFLLIFKNDLLFEILSNLFKKKKIKL